LVEVVLLRVEVVEGAVVLGVGGLVLVLRKRLLLAD